MGINRQKQKALVNYCLNAPKIKRTHIYASSPISFSISCPRGQGHKIEWSEFEGHIWCYKCEKDYFLPWGSIYTGIFSGPIIVQTATMMGSDFRRINLATEEIIPYNLEGEQGDIYNATWVNVPELNEYDKKYDGLE